jgi:hypothetical protein
MHGHAARRMPLRSIEDVCRNCAHCF